MIRALARALPGRGGDRAGRRQCRDLLPRRARDDRQRRHLDAVPAGRAAGAAGAGGGRSDGGAGRRSGCGASRPAAAAAHDRRGIAAPLSVRRRASTARRSPPTASASMRSEPGDLVSIWPWLLHRHQQAVGRSRRVRPQPLCARAQRATGTASSICRSAAARGCASARASRWPKALTMLAHVADRLAVRADPGPAGAGCRER